jgi:pilus assembly protein Flp/PilA
MKNLFARFIKEEEGQDLIEYALLAAFIAVAAIATITTVGGNVNTVFTNVSNALTGQ